MSVMTMHCREHGYICNIHMQLNTLATSWSGNKCLVLQSAYSGSFLSYSKRKPYGLRPIGKQWALFPRRCGRRCGRSQQSPCLKLMRSNDDDLERVSSSLRMGISMYADLPSTRKILGVIKEWIGSCFSYMPEIEAATDCLSPLQRTLIITNTHLILVG